MEEPNVTVSQRASSLRSSKRNSSNPVNNSVIKRAKLSSPAVKDLRKRNGSHQFEQVKKVEASFKVEKPKRRRKPFKGFVNKKRGTKKGKADKSRHCIEVIEAATIKSPKDEDCEASVASPENGFGIVANNDLGDGRFAEEKKVASNEALESQKKVRIGSRKLQAHVNGASPKRCSKSQDFHPSDPCHIQAVKVALHLSRVPDTMICREAEQSKVFQFCKDHLLRQQPGSLYICGCPGTGKSLLMEKVKLMASTWAEECKVQAPDICSLNCTTLTNAGDIFERIYWHVSPHQRKQETKCRTPFILSKLKHTLHKRGDASAGRMLLLIVDEVDYLLNKDQAILQNLFELPSQLESHCILIGISNAIDLVNRCFQNFKALSCRPTVIPFSPYTKDQLKTVLNQRIKELPFPVFQAAALELCARKVAAASGDMRKALHVCRIAIEILELESKTCKSQNGKQASTVDRDLASLKEHNSKEQRMLEQPLVQIHHMAEALAKTFRSAAVDTVKSLPKHQQIILCVAVRLFRQKKKDTMLGQLNEQYLQFCKATSMPALSVLEFSSSCRILVDQGLLNLGTSREERLKRVTLQADEDDVVFALQGIRFFCNHLT